MPRCSFCKKNYEFPLGLTYVLIDGNNACYQPINMNNQNLSAVNKLSFATTSQNTAYTGAPAGTYTNVNMTIDANGKISAISSGTSAVLTGTIIAYAGATVPVGYLKCDATPLSTATYPNLFGVLGYTYGGSGGTFFAPNLLNKFIQGSVSSANIATSGNFTVSNNNISATAITSTDLGGSAPYVAFNTANGISDWTYYKGKASGDGNANQWTPVALTTGTKGGTNLVSAFNTTIGVATPTPLIGTVPSLLMMYIIKT
jgi:microcystin-dependent protein